MFHGLNSHIGHGAHIAHVLAGHGIETVGFDHRGFGRSPGKAGRVASLEEHLADALRFVRMMKKEYEGVPMFALGLSMGGMTTYHLSLRDPTLFEGTILMAPALKNAVNGFLVGVTSVLKKLLP